MSTVNAREGNNGETDYLPRVSMAVTGHRPKMGSIQDGVALVFLQVTGFPDEEADCSGMHTGRVLKPKQAVRTECLCLLLPFPS